MSLTKANLCRFNNLYCIMFDKYWETNLVGGKNADELADYFGLLITGLKIGDHRISFFFSEDVTDEQLKEFSNKFNELMKCDL